MVRGIYTAAMGMLADWFKLDSTANNLANVDTVGYKKDVPTFSAHDERHIYLSLNKRVPIGTLTYSVVVDRVYLDATEGSLQYTGNPLDLAIVGNGYFSVQRNNEVLYTRAGNFKLNAEGFIVNADGFRLLDVNNEPIRFQDGFSIDEEGYVRDQAANVVSRIAVYSFASQQNLRKVGYTLFSPTNESGPAVAAGDFRILSGHVELSNVNAVAELVKMVELQRHFEITQKVVLAEDEMFSKLFSQLATLR